MPTVKLRRGQVALGSSSSSKSLLSSEFSLRIGRAYFFFVVAICVHPLLGPATTVGAVEPRRDSSNNRDFVFDNRIYNTLHHHHLVNHKCSEKSIERREEEANVIFTGTVRSVYPDKEHPNMMKAAVEVKRVIKGDNVIQNLPGVYPTSSVDNDYLRRWNHRMVVVDGIGDPHVCRNRLRKYDTRIFMANKLQNGELKLNSSLVRMTLNNLELAEAAVKDIAYTPKPTPGPEPCERKYCAFGAQCMVEAGDRAVCHCLERCDDLLTPVCGSDGVTYSSECNLRKASCATQKRIRTEFTNSCDVKDPCKTKECSFGAQCRPSLDGLTARCQCPDRCDTYGDSLGSAPVCGSDGSDYEGICNMHKAACAAMKEITIKYVGKCNPCEGYDCPTAHACQLDENRRPVCRCNIADCTLELKEVCGSDGLTYSNECVMRMEGCKLRKEIRILYRGDCTKGTNPCTPLRCGPEELCHVDREGHARCICPPPCEPVLQPVCGSDGTTYDSKCELERQSCLSKRMVAINFMGICSKDGPCSKYQCNFEALCVVRDGRPSCECPTCSEEFKPVCGTDGMTYSNECKMKAESCEKQHNIGLKHEGRCTDYNGCQNKKCEYYSVCEADSHGGHKCVCPKSCVVVHNPVCGTDGVTYSNECEMRVRSCDKKQLVMIASQGACDLCVSVRCKFGARCESGRCVCPQYCPDINEPVCANDGQTYINECEMRRQACSQGVELETFHSGECEESSGSGMEVCDETTCRFGGTCEYDMDGPTGCVCNFNCEAIRSPVCGSDGKTYGNECQMREESCRKQQEIHMQPMDNCEDIDEELCDGNAALVNPSTGREYDCGNGRQSCPSGSYCHRLAGVSRCCKEDSPIRNCQDSKHGCCPDGKTSSPGANRAGCPSTCQCNKLGSFRLTCDPNTRQCYCKPGVGGLKCNRCEQGYWGLPRIAQGNSGCIPCMCNIYGSTRDDCVQMSGECVCKPGIKGNKCDTCPNGNQIGPQGCGDEEAMQASSPNPRELRSGGPMPTSCLDMTCRHGAVCVMSSGKPECVCPANCQQDGSPRIVCGSDGQTYGSACQLHKFSCRLQKHIGVAYHGACTGEVTTPRSTMRSRKTTRHVNRATYDHDHPGPTPSAPDYGLIGDICHVDQECIVKHSYCRMGLCACTQGLTSNEATTLCQGMSYAVPSFSGMGSYLQMKRVHHANQEVSIEIEFRSLSDNGILFYSSQSEDGKGDFISLAIVDRHVLFRYNLGSGAATLRSQHTITLNKYHRLKAKRFGKDGILQLDEGTEATGVSPGALRSLNLGTPIYLGYVPNGDTEVFQNIGTTSAFTGCIESLKLISGQMTKEYNLMYPGSPDVESGLGIAECGQSPCSSMPCQNGGSCRAQGDTYRCDCPDHYSGKTCEVVSPELPANNCAPNPCQAGGSCTSLPGGFFCSCPMGRTGDKCEIMSDSRITEPQFHGDSYLELKMNKDVGRTLNYEVWFRAFDPNGVLLYSQADDDKRDDFLSVNLHNGFLQYRYDCGSGMANITSETPLPLNTWHRVEVQRTNRYGTMTINGGEPIQGHSKGTLKQLNLPRKIWVGGYTDDYNPSSGVTTGFKGAIQRVYEDGTLIENLVGKAQVFSHITQYNGAPCHHGNSLCMNSGNCLPHLNDYMCQCPKTYTGKRCEMMEKHMNTDRPIAFNGHTQHQYPNHIKRKQSSQDNNRYTMRIRTSADDGLLLLQHKSASIRGDYLALAVSRGHVEASFNLGKERDTHLLTLRSEVKVNDGRWHELTFSREKRKATLSVDGEATVTTLATAGATQLDTDGMLWIGGGRSPPEGLPIAYTSGFNGCIDSVSVEDETLDLVYDRTSHGSIEFCDVFIL